MLGIAAILLLLACYRFSIAKAIDEYHTYKEQKAASLQYAGVASLPMLESKNRMLDNLLEQFVLDTLDDSKNLLGITGNYCNQTDIKLKEYKPLAVSGADSMQVLTRNITVEGGFKDCLRLVYELETKYKAGRVSSVLFKSYTEPASAKTFLNCSIHIQNIISSFYEKK